MPPSGMMTVCPAWTNSETPSGVMATRDSWTLISFGTPTSMISLSLQPPLLLNQQIMGAVALDVNATQDELACLRSKDAPL